MLLSNCHPAGPQTDPHFLNSPTVYISTNPFWSMTILVILAQFTFGKTLSGHIQSDWRASHYSQIQITVRRASLSTTTLQTPTICCNSRSDSLKIQKDSGWKHTGPNIEKRGIPNLRPVSVWDWVIWLLPEKDRFSSPNFQFLTNISHDHYLRPRGQLKTVVPFEREKIVCLLSWASSGWICVWIYFEECTDSGVGANCRWWPMNQMLWPLCRPNLLLGGKIVQSK